MERFEKIFPKKKSLIAVIHLPPLPGSPLFNGKIEDIYEKALVEAAVYSSAEVDGIIFENFGDKPFFPGKVPSETVAAMAAVGRAIVNAVKIPVGVNVLRNDASAALGIAAAIGAKFIRVNIHIGAALTDQGVIEGRAFETLRLRSAIGSKTLIFADVAVKHAVPLVQRPIEDEVKETDLRGMADGIILSGSGTGMEIDEIRLSQARSATKLPIICGSGITFENIIKYLPLADAFIVGSYFKAEGKVSNNLDENRVKKFIEKFRSL